MSLATTFLSQHAELTRRYFMRMGLGAAAVTALSRRSRAEPAPADAQEALDALGEYMTPPDDFQDVSRGKPLPHTLPDDRKAEVGLTRESWRLEVISDDEHPVRLRTPLSKAKGKALDFDGLMEIAKDHAVRFPKVMTCLNIGCPLGTGIWEGVPLREVIWRTQPADGARRVFYYGYHNDDPEQVFRSSLPIGRVFEDPYDLPPVILCYKLNGQWLTSERGGPVRVVVPEAYGFKNIKWLSHVVLSNMPAANDTYANENNDIDSPLKTFAATIHLPRKAAAGEKIPVSGYAQVGQGGLAKVQIWVHPESQGAASGSPLFASAPWTDATILDPPAKWGGGLADDKIPVPTLGFTDDGQPKQWPLRLTKVHWVAVLDGLAPGRYTFRCRTIDEHGFAQPMPRPFRKSGHAAIEQIGIEVV